MKTTNNMLQGGKLLPEYNDVWATYFTKFINFNGPINFFIGILEIISEISRIISFAFRLFGNILADELVVGVLVALIPLIVPIPVMLLGVFTSAIQALVFSTLAGAYIGEAVEDHH